jgi:ubiquinol-cytochrome c reductase cytochrome b subunit
MAKPANIVDDHATVAPQTPPREPGPVFKALAGPMRWADERLGLAALVRNDGKKAFYLRKVFPDHWTFLLGEIALYSFIVLLLTGVFLTIWFVPSAGEVEYQGTYQLLRGLRVSEAYASALALSFDIRGGLLMRQAHHWAAMVFVAAMLVHSLRIFFTGAFRKPREINWLIGVALIGLGLIEGFAGYSLPDDLLSGTGLRFVDGLIRSIPVLGTWIEFFTFGGEFPGSLIIPRLYMVHILLIPALILGLVAVHLALVFYHKHTQYPGPGRNDNNVIGYPLYPVYTAKAGGFFFIVFGVILLMGGLMQINPVWVFGAYNPAEVTAGSQPDWYMGFVEGAIRIMPNWEWHIGHTTWSWNVAIPGLGLMGLLFGLMAAYPFVEAWVTGDRSEHHILERPRNNPTRTAFGVAAVTGFGLFWIGGGNDLIATQFHVSLNAVTYFLRVAVFVGPVLAFVITKRICIGLQRADHERHRPVAQGEAYMRTQHLEHLPLLPATDGDVPAKELKRENLRRRATRFFSLDTLRKPGRDELEAAAHHQGEVHEDLGYAGELGNGHGNGHHEVLTDGSEIDDDTEFKPAH